MDIRKMTDEQLAVKLRIAQNYIYNENSCLRLIPFIRQCVQDSTPEGLTETEITKLLKELLLTPKPLKKKPTIAELEKILNSGEGSSTVLLPDGEVACLTPTMTIEDISRAIHAARERKGEI